MFGNRNKKYEVDNYLTKVLKLYAI